MRKGEREIDFELGNHEASEGKSEGYCELYNREVETMNVK